MSDKIHRFIFDAFGIRGELVNLDKSMSRLIGGHNYPAPIADLLQQVAAVSLMLTTTIKFEGKMSVQLQTPNRLKLMVVQANHKLGYRGIARFEEGASFDNMSFEDIVKNGQLTITIEPKKGKRYQGIVALDKTSFAECIEEYFNQSEQLKTRIWLFNNNKRVVGLMLQALPDMLNEDSFDHLVFLANTLNAEESLSIDGELLLQRLFHQESIRSLEVDPITFHCGCNQKKMLDSLALFPDDELQEIIAAKGEVAVKCEFCLSQFKFSDVDIKNHRAVKGNQTQH